MSSTPTYPNNFSHKLNRLPMKIVALSIMAISILRIRSKDSLRPRSRQSCRKRIKVRTLIRRSLNNNRLQYRMCPAAIKHSLITINVNPPALTTLTPLKMMVRRPKMSVSRTTTRAHNKADAQIWLRKSQRPIIWTTIIMMRNLVSMRMMPHNWAYFPIQRPSNSASITVAAFNSSASTHQTCRSQKTSLMKVLEVRMMTMSKRGMKVNMKKWLTTLWIMMKQAP